MSEASSGSTKDSKTYMDSSPLRLVSTQQTSHGLLFVAGHSSRVGVGSIGVGVTVAAALSVRQGMVNCRDAGHLGQVIVSVSVGVSVWLAVGVEYTGVVMESCGSTFCVPVEAGRCELATLRMGWGGCRDTNNAFGRM